MALKASENHPRRFELTNELHARPYMPMAAPGRAVALAFKPERNAQERAAEADRAHLSAFIDRHGGQQPSSEANHYIGSFGRFAMKWERHTEFVSYTLIEEGPAEPVFTASLAQHFPPDWIAEAPGKIIAGVEIAVLSADGPAEAEAIVHTGGLARQFSGESLAIARVIDDQALALGDFRIHEGGFSRFAIVVHGDVGSRRVGRAVQRLIEVENYRVLAMLALPIARRDSARLHEIDRELTQLIEAVAARDRRGAEQDILDELTALSAEIEAMSAASAFRFAAARAYEAIVHERIAGLREQRHVGRQLFSEFMKRRFDPAMRTVRATEDRLDGLATRASRIADLLRTRVDVALEAQNQRLLHSMDRRAAMQLRLQETVEGFSVVAISYYAVSLGGYVLAPVARFTDYSADTLTTFAALPVLVFVWWFVRRIKRRVSRHAED